MVVARYRACIFLRLKALADLFRGTLTFCNCGQNRESYG